MSSRPAFRLSPTWAAIGLAAALASCAPRREPPAPSPPPPPVQPRPDPTPPPPPPLDWDEAPLAAGDWSLDGNAARFGNGGRPDLVVQCENGRIALVRPGAQGSLLVVRTSFGDRSLPASRRSDGLAAALAASDPLLDAIVFSRGRFAVGVDAQAPLIVPTWPEPARVVEDCRARR